uniref:Uncharacterized protein n=1 Tax=Glossina morsitans morsitans TaxID=37546 RepID=A0A1B0G7F9_GLOMM
MPTIAYLEPLPRPTKSPMRSNICLTHWWTSKWHLFRSAFAQS